MTDSKFHVETNMVPIWEQEQPSFQEIMADQLRHAPWIGISILAHAVAGFLLATFWVPEPPKPPEKVITAAPPPPPEDLPPPPPPPPPPEPEEVETDEVVIQETEVTEVTENQSFNDFDSDNPTKESAFNSDGWNSAIGLGGGAGGLRGGRGGGRAGLGKGGRQTARAIELGLEWLRKHQDDDGKWDCDDFAKHDVEGEACDDAGNPTHDVGVTALALLAFLGDGSTMKAGPYQEQVKKAVRWLREQQDPDSGLIGTKASHEYIYDHTLAALALVEAAGLSKSRLVKRNAEKAIEYLEYHRNPYGVWRYEPKSGDNDSSITGWAVFAYKSAKDFDYAMNPEGLKASLTWFDSMTDAASGRTGYIERGGLSSRRPGEHETKFPREKGECMTAVSLLCRIFIEKGKEGGEDLEFDKETQQLLDQQADLISKKLPEWDTEGGIDHYYWYYGTYALFQMGGRRWKAWEKALNSAVVKTQRDDGNYLGSWDADGVWGEDGGRVYSTALLVLTLEAYYRYSRLIR